MAQRDETTETALIDHLSGEIRTLVETMMTFRSRINFSVWAGPCFLLGAVVVGAKAVPVGMKDGACKYFALAGLVAGYAIMGWACATIEAHAWRQSNAWRRLIAQVQHGRKLKEEELVYENPHLRVVYFIVYAAMALAAVSTLGLLTQVEFAGLTPD